MTATWRAPVTWATGNLVTATNLNEQLRDNLEFLKTPPTGLISIDEASDYTTTSTSFVDVDSAGDPDLSLDLTTAGGDVLIVFMAYAGGTGRVYFDIAVDSVRMATNDGFFSAVNAVNTPITIVALKQGLAPGSHNFKVQWKVNTGTGTLYAGAGTSALDTHPLFFVREV